MSQASKKLVSKGEYARVQAGRAALSSFGSVVFLIGLFCLVITFAGIVSIFWRLCVTHSTLHDWLMFLLSILVAGGIVGGCSIALMVFGKSAVMEAKATDAGVPLTHSNTGDLPAQDSLVRASEQPATPQQTVLLRPAIATDETPVEHLLRPS